MLKRSMYLMLSPENKERKGRSSTGERSPSSSCSSSNGWERSKERSKKQRPAAAAASGSGAPAAPNRRKYRRVFRIRIRVTSRLHFLERLREMCVRLVMGTSQVSASASSSKRNRAVSPAVKCDQSAYVRSLYCEDAVADCIKFIKQTAAAAESRSLVR